MNNFVSQYLRGQTPNPCVECNRHIKFTEMIRLCKELDADYVATGHYVQRTYNAKKKIYYLNKALDQRKDQSYFLYMLNNDMLSKILFPLGNYEKPTIREMANDFNLITANKPDSQEICFVTKDTYKQFIEERTEHIEQYSGLIVDTTGKVLGSHKGIYGFTIGQRKGLGISSPHPLYVLEINSENKTVVVGPKEDLNETVVPLDQFCLVNDNVPILGKTLDIKTRYQMTPVTGKIVEIKGDKAKLELDSPPEFLAPGQSAVLYSKERVLGGGIIT